MKCDAMLDFDILSCFKYHNDATKWKHMTIEYNYFFSMKTELNLHSVFFFLKHKYHQINNKISYRFSICSRIVSFDGQQ